MDLLALADERISCGQIRACIDGALFRRKLGLVIRGPKRISDVAPHPMVALEVPGDIPDNLIGHLVTDNLEGIDEEKQRRIVSSVLLTVILMFFLNDYYDAVLFYAAISISCSVLADDAANTALTTRVPLRVS
jgi:hypothetical protein